ncbi:histidinol-phosphate aminotransferase family protein [Deinococcus cavernae]|uniref:Histidinol-phosphate aminotransferase n=1 Tax=Deinococcus cavernae TaxID=2320857 RepID=A0A418V872_9DEIO|nr:histidinol-phosphate transaminase [Deinococcus cavernae]RJF72288.1 histidinol-phosphate aminotransferase family protein [Deinococcus cavernae]
MTSTPLSQETRGIRAAVRKVSAYPFTPIDVPIKLDQNENPYDFPAELKAEAARRMLERPWNRYPDLHADKLREALARYEDWDAGSIVVTPGSNVLIKILTELAGINQTMLVTKPTFSVYTLEASLLDAKLVEVPLNPDFSLPVAELKAALEREAPGVFAIAEPHAPTGHADRPEDVQELVRHAEQYGWVTVLDEAYYQYSGTDYRDLVRAHPNALSLRTFSKAWGLAGVRLGYILAGQEIAHNLQKLVSAFNVNILTETVLEVALEHPEYVQRIVQETVRERERVFAALQNHPTCQALPSQANYFLLRTPDAQAAYRHLLSRGIVTRPQDGQYLLKGCLRVAIGTPGENDTLIAAVNELK